jgi:proline iminopeptidase
MFPEIAAYEQGLLDVGGGQKIHWESYGNPDGQPALFLHGGPGSGSSPSAARYFDPAAYRIILFDQRNCGRSLPSAADVGTDLSTNTTWNLVADIEKLRRHLSVSSWVLFG